MLARGLGEVTSRYDRRHVAEFRAGDSAAPSVARASAADGRSPAVPSLSQLRKLRAVLMAGGADFDELYRHLRLMEPALQLTVQDLR